MSLSRLTKITGPGIATDTNLVGNNANFTGVTTTGTSFNVGVTTIHSTLIESHNIKSTGIITATGAHFSGDVSIGGTLTYEDVTNIDSVGIITSKGADINGDLDVDGHTNLDNVSIAGVTTTTGHIRIDADNKKLFVGADSDIQIYNNGSDSYLQNINGQLIIKSPILAIQSSSHNQIIVRDGAEVELFYKGVMKLETASSGISVVGTTTSTQLAIAGVSTFTGAIDANGDLDVDGHTNLDNVSIAGVSTFSNGLFLPDDQQVKLGNTAASPDLKIYHNTVANTTSPPNYLYPNSNYIDSVAAANLFIRTSTAGIYLGRTDGAHAASFHTTTAGVVLYHNASGGGGEKFRTVAGGIDVTGDVTLSDSIIHTGDTNTKIRFPAADTISMETAGSERLRIASDGNMGLGTNSLVGNAANVYLTVNGSTLGGIALKANGTNQGYLQGTSSLIRLSSDGSKPITFDTNGSERLRITSDGNVHTNGLGTFEFNNGWSAEGRNVVVWPCDDAGNWFSFVGTNLRFTDGGNFVKPSDNSNSNWGNIAGIVFEGVNQNNNNGNYPAIRFVVDQPGGNGANYSLGSGSSGRTAAIDNNTAMSISGNRNVGINYSNPAYPLDVRHTGGNLNQTPIIRVFQSQDGCHNAITLESSTSADKNIGIQFKNRNTVRGGIGYIQNDKIHIYAGTSAGTSMGMTINANGIVTNPNTPAFRAHDSNHAQNGFLTFDQIATNVGSHYNGSNGRFTAPIAGTYFFSFYGMCAAGNQNARVEYYINGSVHSSGEHYGGVAYTNGQTYNMITCNTVLTLSQNDYVNLNWNASYNSMHSYHNGFMGFLIG